MQPTPRPPIRPTLHFLLIEERQGNMAELVAGTMETQAGFAWNAPKTASKGSLGDADQSRP